MVALLKSLASRAPAAPNCLIASHITFSSFFISLSLVSRGGIHAEERALLIVGSSFFFFLLKGRGGEIGGEGEKF